MTKSKSASEWSRAVAWHGPQTSQPCVLEIVEVAVNRLFACGAAAIDFRVFVDGFLAAEMCTGQAHAAHGGHPRQGDTTARSDR
jgi:hypothetical protein